MAMACSFIVLAVSRAVNRSTSTLASVNWATLDDSSADRVATLQINAPRARITGRIPTTARMVVRVGFMSFTRGARYGDVPKLCE